MASQDWFDKDFYAVLGVAKDVGDAELKKVYRKLARENHPDTHPGDARAEARFKEISEAYSVLSDKEQRAEYDQLRAMGTGARFAPGGSGGGFEDVFSGMFGNRGGTRVTFGNAGGFDDVLGGLFGSGRFGQSTGGFRGNGGPTRGEDVHATAALDFLDAIRGETVALTLPGGRTTKVKLPAGVADGQRIRLRGRGQPSPDGGEAGDLLVSVTVRPHPVFARDGLNLRVEVPVTFAEAVLGATIQVPTLDGDTVRLKVAPGTPSGRVLRVKGRGVQTAKATGDLLAEIVVAVPRHLPEGAKDALRSFVAALPEEDPREDLLARARGAAR